MAAGWTVEDGLTLNGTATIADGFNALYFLVGTLVLGGDGTAVFGNPGSGTFRTYNYLSTDAATSTLTLGPGINSGRQLRHGRRL